MRKYRADLRRDMQVRAGASAMMLRRTTIRQNGGGIVWRHDNKSLQPALVNCWILINMNRSINNRQTLASFDST